MARRKTITTNQLKKQATQATQKANAKAIRAQKQMHTQQQRTARQLQRQKTTRTKQRYKSNVVPQSIKAIGEGYAVATTPNTVKDINSSVNTALYQSLLTGGNQKTESTKGDQNIEEGGQGSISPKY